MEKERIMTDKKFYVVMVVAAIALVVGAAGLIVGLVKSPTIEPSVLLPSSSGSSSPGGTIQEVPTPYTGPERSGSVQRTAP